MKRFISIKSILKILCLILFFCYFCHNCLYTSMTHMSGEELEWVTNRKRGEKMCFRSPDGSVDTVIIRGIDISNYFDPINWAYFNTGRRAYHANAEVRYDFGFLNLSGSLSISKSDDDKPITFSPYLSNMLFGIPLNTTTLKVDGKILNDVMFFDNESPEALYKFEDNLIKNYYWSKKYGLVQYTLKDGTVFSRIDLDKQARR